MRLIDADKVGNGMAETWQKAIVRLEVEQCATIDPETLPIVQELKQQLAEVTKERDAAVNALENVAMFDDSLCRYCALSDKCGIDQSESCMRFEWKGVDNHE